MTEPKYDVAISFLSADEAVSTAVCGRLSEGLEVFFYPRTQEALAGTDGLESMRAPFLPEGSRVVVVFYRERWGQTPWTGVEEMAIRDRCLKDKFQGLFVIMLDPQSAPPAWLPDTHVRFNYADFGLEQAVGAIKARVKERGGTIAPVTALRRAQLYQQEQDYLDDRQQRLRGGDARSTINHRTSLLFERMETLCEQMTRTIWGCSSLRENRGKLSRPKPPRESDRGIAVEQFRVRIGRARILHRKLAVPAMGEQPIYAGGQPRGTRTRRLLPDVNRAREYGWVEQGDSDAFITGEALADQILIDFVNLTQRVEQAPRRPRSSRHPLR